MKLGNPKDTDAMDSNYRWTRVLHDLKNPVGVIFGYADMLRRPHVAENPTKVLQYADKIHFSSKLLLRLIQDLCEVQYSHDQRHANKFANVQTITLFQSLLEPYALRAMQKGLFFEVLLSKPIPNHLSVDAMRLSQILGNLIDNGIKYTDTGGITLTLDFHETNNRQGTFVVSIADTGCGLSSDLREKIFEPYFRVEPDADGLEGQGIGLASARMIAQQLGGELRLIASEIDKGCEFALEIPSAYPDFSDLISAIELQVSALDLMGASATTPPSQRM